MLVLHEKRICERKMNQLKNGYSAYAESREVIRLIKREILKNNMDVYYDETPNGCWFIPMKESMSS
ncbi:hypothetical protein SAMN05216389_111138 [Oceanobacillus limi]|uniref:Uncharacterized protein n=1 Tax=Oceanobacillus limi TaxID=930131 RepID=A0A1I0EIQ4_9BACI|nr:hypothetical protein [Oceanobacillus limi]SET44847.1 hypothetical protein SAMN05216389_111138 [Oceanobacillus limi]